MKHSNQIITKSSEWYDKDIMILYACFQILKDSIEKDSLLTLAIDWNINEDSVFARKEIEVLYNWWKERRLLEILDNLSPLEMEKQYEIDNQMLIRLIKIRKYLWI